MFRSLHSILYIAGKAELKTNWRPLTLSEILAQEQCANIVESLGDRGLNNNPHLDPQIEPSLHHREKQASIKAEREWIGAIAAVEHLLKQTLLTSTQVRGSVVTSDGELEPGGVVIAGPSPVLTNRDLLAHLSCWTLSPNTWASPMPLPPSASDSPLSSIQPGQSRVLVVDDGLGMEQFCWVLTSDFSLIVVLGEDLEGVPTVQFSFDPSTILKIWHGIGLRIQWSSPAELSLLTQQVQAFIPKEPNYQVVTQFSRLWLRYLPEAKRGVQPVSSEDLPLSTWPSRTAGAKEPKKGSGPSTPPQDVELLKAIAHEVRTPLTTIRTLARLLLKRKTLPSDIRPSLEKIDRECTQQIDRFSLFFQAVELETASPHSQMLALTTTSLSDVIQHSIPRWQQQAGRLDQTLCVKMPQHMPTVVSNPAMLDQALMGLIEQFTRSLPQGSDIQIQVTQAGHQLKLQLQASPPPGHGLRSSAKPIFRSLGKLLMFQPETGSLTLNLSVTKNLFQALGGKLIVRERPIDGEILTVYLPLGS